MSARVLTRLCAGLTVFGFVLWVTGCGTTKIAPERGGLLLGPEEQRLAMALAHYGQALIYEVEEGKLSSKAVAELAKASELDPERHLLHSKVAVAALLQNQPKVAVEALEKSWRASPDSFSVALDLGTAYQIAGMYDLSAKTFREAIRLAPKETTPHVALANLQFFRRADGDALNTLVEAVRATGNASPIAEFSYGQALRFLQEKSIRRSIPCFQFAAEHSPQRAQIYHLVGELYEELDQKTDAIRSYSKAISEPSPLPQSFVKLALLQLDPDSTQAVKTLTDGGQRLPEDLLIPLTLAQIHSAEGHLTEAMEVFERVSQTVEKRSEQKRLTSAFYLQFGAVCERAGNRDKAEKVFENCLAVYPDAHESLNFLAYMWAEKAVNLDKALRYVRRALELDPENGAYVDTLGWIYYQQGKYADAAIALQRASELTVNDPTILDHMGDALNALGCGEDALPYWKTSLQIFPANRAVAEKLRAGGLDPDQIVKEAAIEKARKTKTEEKGTVKRSGERL